MDTPEKTLPEAPKRRGRGRPRINTEQPAHMLLGGAVRVYKRDGSARYWQCSAHFDGKKFRTSTKEESLELAKQFAEDWYLGLKGKKIAGVLITEKTFSDVAEIFLKEYQTITEGQRSAKWARGHEVRIRVHLNPFFGDMNISDITAGRVQEYRVARMTPKEEKNPHAEDNRPHKAKAPARSTLHDEIVTLRQVLKTAIRHGWLTALPDLSAPYKSQGKVVHRPWFSPSEYKALYTETRAQTKVGRPQDIWNAEQLHDYVLFMGNTGLRPDEAGNLLHRDIQIIEDADTGDQILLIEVRGKRGVGYCKSTPNAVKPYSRILICNDRAVLYCDRSELTGWGEAGVPRYHTQFIAISGIVEFRSKDPSKLPTTTTKRGIDASSPLYLQVKNKMREGMTIFTDYTNKWKGQADATKKHMAAGRPMSLEQIKEQKLQFSKTTKSVPAGSQYRPTLPMPKKIEAKQRRISYVKDIKDVNKLALYLFEDENASPSDVGEKCFDLMLKEAR